MFYCSARNFLSRRTPLANWPLDRNAEKIAFYGDPFRAGFERDNIVTITPPWQMRFTDDSGNVSPVRGVRVHKKCSVSLQTVFNKLWDHYGRNQHNIEAAGLADFAGSYVKRNVRGSSSAISCHAFGAAIDLNPAQNQMNYDGNRGAMPDAVVQIFKSEGWFWGGDFKSRKDPMHFQAAHEGVPVVPDHPIEDRVPPEPQDGGEEQAVATDGPKPLYQSNLARAGAGIGVGGGLEVINEANNFAYGIANLKQNVNQLGVWGFIQAHAGFIFGVIAVCLAGYIIYKKYHDNKQAKQ